MPYFEGKRYLIRRKILKLVGGAFHVYDESGDVVAYTKMKAFKLKEDLRMYTGEDMEEEIFSIKARNIMDFAATYDVFDSKTGKPLGAFRRKGFKSMLRDEWLVFGPGDVEVGKVSEDSMALALVRRFVSNLIPQTYDCEVDGKKVCVYKQNFNPFVTKVNVVFEPGCDIDRSLLMAGGVLLCAIEGKQD